MFVETVRDNIILARESSADYAVVIEALQTVRAWDWVRRLPRAACTTPGSGHRRRPTPAQAQRSRWPGWWSLTRPRRWMEATSSNRSIRGRLGISRARWRCYCKAVPSVIRIGCTPHTMQPNCGSDRRPYRRAAGPPRAGGGGGEYARLWRAWTS